MQEHPVQTDQGVNEAEIQAEIHRLLSLIQDFLTKFQSAIEKDEAGKIKLTSVSAELSDIFNLLDKELLLHIAGITETPYGPVQNFIDYVKYTVGLRKERQERCAEELDDREFYSQRIAQAINLARILYPQNISETPREIDARDMLLRLGLTISEQATTEDITYYFDSLNKLMDEIIIIQRHKGTTTYSLSDPSIPRENNGKMYKLKKALEDLELLLPVFQSYQDTILAIENSSLEEEDKKALLFLLSSPYKKDFTNRDNWPNGFVRFYDKNSEWITKNLSDQSEKIPNRTQ